MDNSQIQDVYLKDVMEWNQVDFLEDGLILLDRFSRHSVESRPWRMNFILMALCRKGKAKYTLDTMEQSIHPGDLLFISERHVISNYIASPDFECLCIMVSNEFYHSFVQTPKNVSSLLLFSMNYPVVSLTSREIQTYTNYFDCIREKMNDVSHHFRVDLVKALLLAMFYDMSNVIRRLEKNDQKTRTRAEAIFANFIGLLEANYRSERRVSWYANQLCITPKYLSEVIKTVSKRTPNEWIDSYVVLEIRVLLKNSTKSIKDIAEAMNFPNQSFLGKYFKEHVGISPSAFRKG